MTSDIVNAIFESIGAAITLLSVRQLYKDKEIKGVSAWPWVFFTGWGIWNLFYYPSLEQSWSAGAALAMVTVNLWWLILYWRFRK